jgi:hypothetical protein
VFPSFPAPTGSILARGAFDGGATAQPVPLGGPASDVPTGRSEK